MAIANGTCVSFCNQPKAHFSLPWVRPGDNRGKCHMYEKKIQCLSNASHHVGLPIYLQLFPSNLTRKFISSPFRTFFAHFGLPGYAPGKIAVNVTWVERGFNAGQTHRSIPMYLQPFTSYSEILVGNCNFFLPPCI